MFKQQVKAVCETYLEAPVRHIEGEHTVSTDEMTGIQALERKHATKPMRPGEVEKREFEYIRHGTLALIANFDVVTGQVPTPSLGPTRTEAISQRILRKPSLPTRMPNGLSSWINSIPINRKAWCGWWRIAVA